MICRKYTKERNLYPNHGYGKKLIAETATMRKMGKHMNTCMQACRHAGTHQFSNIWLGASTKSSSTRKPENLANEARLQI
jgi:hypothetical protein